ncbi:MAG: hypothetical protein ACTHQE_18580 [Thermomicrobiales bacterium]
MNRREAIVAGSLGTATGSLWAGGFGLLLGRRAPTLEVIGRGDDLAALLDTGSFRTLIVAGEGRRDRIRSLLGVFRRRVDLLLGSERGITVLGTREIARLHVGRTFVLDAPVGARSWPARNATGPATLRAELPDHLLLEVSTFPRGAWQQDVPVTQTWTVTVSRGYHRCMIAPSLDVIAAHGGAGLACGIGVDGGTDELWDMLRVPTMAINADRFPSAVPATQPPRNFRIFPNDPLTFTFGDNGIAVKE